ncbi:hypothetical protein VB796_19245 [Arcicella sp. LKC2W]|uniref:hypothetical protein n=1 Tax=Arcicella sp. LKC2W TaxID=2984198 RepID=UPI002B1FFCFE|nr:hypothetical protein [Arcicella sp. LKC2W]MEA5461208.1 hypothetical protein [Arcicella sp. LKC2W]
MKKHLPNSKTFLLSIFCLTLFIFSATAQQTKKISLQGFLKDGNGKAVADGNQEIIFKLYPSKDSPTAEWEETQTINVFGGVYSTHLGSETNPLDNLSWGSKTYFVGVTVQGSELNPRTELTFAPYSLGSPKAQEVVCSGAVGDVKHSILNPTQFAAVNGNCWVAMDGRSLATTDKLRQITGMTTLPNGGGLFIRSQEFANSSNFDDDRNVNTPIASFQSEDLKSHTHSTNLSVSGSTSSNGNHTHTTGIPGRSEEGGFIAQGNPFSSFSATDRAIQFYHNINSSSPGDHSHSISGSATGNTNSTGGNETRPDNLNFWVYIRIN